MTVKEIKDKLKELNVHFYSNENKSNLLNLLNHKIYNDAISEKRDEIYDLIKNSGLLDKVQVIRNDIKLSYLKLNIRKNHDTRYAVMDFINSIDPFILEKASPVLEKVLDSKTLEALKSIDADKILLELDKEYENDYPQKLDTLKEELLNHEKEFMKLEDEFIEILSPTNIDKKILKCLCINLFKSEHHSSNIDDDKEFKRFHFWSIDKKFRREPAIMNYFDKYKIRIKNVC